MSRWELTTRSLTNLASCVGDTLPRQCSSWTFSGFQFLPGRRIQAGAGTDRDVTLFNCFVIGTIEVSIPGIFCALEEGAVTMQRGGGVGYDFSTTCPSGSRSRRNCLGTALVHGCLGHHVRHHPIHRRDDGYATLRLS